MDWPTVKTKSFISLVINDFLESGRIKTGYGFWENNNEAVKYAITIGKNQKNMWVRYKIIPASLLRYLESTGQIPKIYVDPKQRTIDYLLDLLVKS